MSSPTTRNLYSLNDRPVICDMGQFGNFTINPRPEGAPWGVTILADWVTLYDKGEDDHPRHVTTGTAFAEDIVNRYPGYGLFMAAVDDHPSAEEIAVASLEFELHDMSLIATAHQVWDAKKDRSKIDARARDAARRRNQIVDWATTKVVTLRLCPFCGENIRDTAAKCKHCGEWIDASKRPVAPQPSPAQAPEAELERPSVGRIQQQMQGKR